MSEQFSLPGLDVFPQPQRRARAPHVARPRHGLFFGILPAPADLARIEVVAAALRRQHGMARGPVDAERLHITCCDLGSFSEALPPGLVESAMAVAADLVLPSFEIVFGRVMRFKGNEALVLLEQEGGTALRAFRDALGQALVQAGVPVDFDGTLHMTLAYGSEPVSEPLAESVRWVVQDFVLIDSLFGRSQHRHLGRWQLGPRP